MKKKYISWIVIFVTVLAVGIPRLMSVNVGLPYNQFYDEPLLTEGALNGLKRGFDGNEKTNILAVSSEVVYGGFMRYTMMIQDAVYFTYLLITDNEVTSLGDIKTGINGEQILTTSHPGFYYWNRVYHVSLSVLAFVVVFLIIKKMYGTTYGVLALLIMAGNTFLFSSSFIVVANIPLATLTIISIYFAIQYNYSKEYKFLIWSLVFSGLSMATKMTGAATILVPLIAGLSNYSELKGATFLKTLRKIFYLGLIPLGVFLLLSPSVYLNTGQFIHWMKWLSNLYKTGQGHASMEPGFDHLIYQLNFFGVYHGYYFLILAGVGVITGLLGLSDIKGKKKDYLLSNTLILFLLPLTYILFVTFQYKISYHRNFIFYYPILSILSVVGIAFFVNSFLLISSKLKKYHTLFIIIAATGIANINWSRYKSIYRGGYTNYSIGDTRSKAVKNFTALVDTPFHLGIENGLKMSFAELRGIKYKYSFFDIANLDSALLGYTHLLVPEYQFVNNDLRAFPDSTIKLLNKEINDRLISKIEGGKIDYFHYLAIWTPIVNPEVKLIRGTDYPPPLMESFSYPIINYPSVKVLDQREDVVFNGMLQRGLYNLSFDISGMSALGEAPILEIKLNDKVLEQIPAASLKEIHRRIKIEIEENKRVSFKLRLLNDFYSPETGEDRNIFLRSFKLKKEIE